MGIHSVPECLTPTLPPCGEGVGGSEVTCEGRRSKRRPPLNWQVGRYMSDAWTGDVIWCYCQVGGW